MAETVGLPYLDALTGKSVRVFKGGPDSREGRLIGVLSDYIVLQTGKDEQTQLVYYARDHLKIVVANSKKSQVDLLAEEEETVYPTSFLGVLSTLQTSCIQVNGGGPGSKVGRVVDVKDEFLVLSTEKDGLVLYPISHIKSVTVIEQSDEQLLPEFVYNGTDTLNGLLTRIVHNWVSVFAGGPERVEGILMEVADTYLIVVHNQELFYVPTDHVQFVALTVRVEEEAEEETDENSEDGGSSDGGASNANSANGNSANGSRKDESSSLEESSSSYESSSSSSSYESSSSSSSSSSSDERLGRRRSPRANAFKQIWIENLMKASNQNIR